MSSPLFPLAAIPGGHCHPPPPTRCHPQLLKNSCCGIIILSGVGLRPAYSRRGSGQGTDNPSLTVGYFFLSVASSHAKDRVYHTRNVPNMASPGVQSHGEHLRRGRAIDTDTSRNVTNTAHWKDPPLLYCYLDLTPRSWSSWGSQRGVATAAGA